MPQQIIKILAPDVVKLIAAGEVVERPASAVKELIENSIDAASKVISIEIERGGISKIKVRDNGVGINKKYLRTAFLPHATSKLNSEDDLYNISTLGFRGEALASIAAVSKLSITTCTENEIIGTRYDLEALQEKYFDDEGCNKGTTIIVKDLFFNLPARMKFLKRDATEAAIIENLVDKMAISHPKISFKFIKDGVIKLHTPGDGRLISAISEIWNKDLARAMIPVEYEEDFLKISGYISHPSAAKSSRNFEYFFVNNRCVRHLTLASALEEGYKNSLVQNKRPACVLNIISPYSFVDVNVHPAKTDVKFLNDKLVYRLVYNAVKTALQSAVLPVVYKTEPDIFKNLNNALPELRTPTIEELKIYQKNEIYTKFPLVMKKIENIIEKRTKKEYDNYEKPQQEKVSETVSENLVSKAQNGWNSDDLLSKEFENSFNEKQKSNENSDVLGHLIFVGEIWNTYIICTCETDDKIVFIDKHAAHERLNYEKLQKNKYQLSSQLLIAPLVLNLSKQEYVCAVENKQIFYDLGFELNDFGEKAIIIRAVPADLEDSDIEEIISQIIGDLIIGKNKISIEKRDRIIYNIACKMAIKSHNINSCTELKFLVDKLNKKKGLVCCPHGRPVCCVLKKKEIEKWFMKI